MIRVVIADDEPLSRRRLRDLIQEQPDLEIVAEETDGPSTIAAIDSLEPDLVFLDIRMPGATGLEVVDRIHARPWIVFTTAYDRYAVTAFELQALDYLLKPFGPERFLAALDRVREAMGSALEPPLHRAGSALRGNAALERIFVRQRGRIIPVSMERVERLEAQGDYAELHTAGRRHLVSVRIKEFESRLDPTRFMRIHRSHIVNMDFIVALAPYDGARLEVEMASGARIVASRRMSRRLRELVV